MMKHIKRFFILLLINSICLTCSSQNENNISSGKKKKRTEIGLNVTSLLNAVIDFTENEPVEEPFDFVLKRVGEKSAFRFHFGAIGNKQRDQNDTDLTILNTNLNLKLGQEWRKKLLNRFDFMYGYDFIFAHNLSRVQNKDFSRDVVTLINRQYIFGPEVFVGVFFHINEKLYLSTQGGFNFLYDNSQEKLLDSSNFLPEDKEKTNGFSFRTIIPKSIHLFLKF